MNSFFQTNDYETAGEAFLRCDCEISRTDRNTTNNGLRKTSQIGERLFPASPVKAPPRVLQPASRRRYSAGTGA
jgi:hypothetical protein